MAYNIRIHFGFVFDRQGLQACPSVERVFVATIEVEWQRRQGNYVQATQMENAEEHVTINKDSEE